MNNGYQTNQIYNPYNQKNPTNNNTGNTINVIAISGGEDSAINYVLEPNSTVFFMSQDTSELFMRGTDINGMTNLFKAFDIKEKIPSYQVSMLEQTTDFATKEDINTLSNEIKELKKFLDELTSPDAKG